MDRRQEPARSELLSAVKKRLADRLRDVCAGMPAVEFDALVARMADIEIKYARRRADDQIKTGQPSD